MANRQHTPALRRRREQQRAINTRAGILEAALIEFADKGFEGASTRGISKRAGLPQPLITYHFKSKAALWRAVAKECFREIEQLWDERIPQGSTLTPTERVREEFKTFFHFTILHPAFHHFMLRENIPGGPRLAWLVKNMISRTFNRIVPQIRAAQEAGEMIQGDPILLYYVLIGMTSALSSLSSEMRATSKMSAKDPSVVDSYWDLISRSMFQAIEK